MQLSAKSFVDHGFAFGLSYPYIIGLIFAKVAFGYLQSSHQVGAWGTIHIRSQQSPVTSTISSYFSMWLAGKQSVAHLRR